MKSLDVGVIGAGTAGSTLALFAARAGHRVTVYEAVPDPQPIGAGIVLQPSGQAVLGMLGLLGEILDRGARLDRLHCVRSLGQGRFRSVVDLNYDMVGQGTFGLGLHRGALFSVLHAALRSQAGVTLKTAFEVKAVEGTSDRREIVSVTGERTGAHDLVVIADGAGSDIVTSDTLPRRMRPYTWGAVWFVAPDPDQVFRGQLYQVVRGAHHMLGFLPTGTAPTAPEPVVSLYWSLRGDRLAALKSSDLSAWKSQIIDYEPKAAFIVDRIQSPDQLLFAHYRDVTSPNGVWHAGRTVRIGDAAHAMSPQLGQGANLALIDGAVLASSLEEDSVQASLAAYSQRRRAQLGYYQWATRWLTPFFQGDSGLLPWMRDVGMPIGMMVPWVKKQMVTSMAGVHRGILRTPMSLEAKRLVSGS